ncbi:prepilin-type N-terminal cleavage/methylation domain-containing protein [Sulfitobacter albidus]|uniref:Type II secretion system protein J n=1 Tax=Sulfitobacter albidus TaxID=2829501 RepID=A0A975JGN5_9RHOB|nr:type II secretion system protein GspJ [Sulfitobacter albidus]QUJ77920.1 prepilin-type N-terminal cleavage/methylation domain-containing protein [Sulfitobacter albidus]
MSQPRREPEAGVSLIEVLVSLAIFALIGVAGLAVLNTVARTGARTDGRLERLADIDRTFVILRRDLLQMTGASTQLQDNALQFARPIDEGIVIVTYIARDGVFVRRVARAASPDVDQRLLENVQSAQWRTMDAAGRWHDSWPPTAAETIPAAHAAELSVTLRADPPETLVRLFALPAGQGR